MMDALPLFDARQAGLEEGLAEGERNAKLETARKLLEENIPIETIAKCTGLSLDEVNNLKN